MPIIAKATGTDFVPAPAGAHSGVCCDVADLGILQVEYQGEKKMQHKIRVSWQIGEDMDNGEPFVVSKRYTLSLHERAGLRKDLESWRGRMFTENELKGFDVEMLIGAPCMLNVVRASRDGKEYANVTSVMPLLKGMVRLKVRNYVRLQDRAPANGAAAPVPVEIDDEDVPF